tara:strand:+ start:12051 stop:12788 length:738 start_codon:yes stop_codon:yes gene_type:complete
MIVCIADREKFIRCFLKPIGSFADIARITIGDSITTTVSNTDKTCILAAEYNTNTGEGTNDIAVRTRKLLSSFECVDEETITVDVKDNTIKYKSSGMRFKLHTLDLSVVPKIGVNINSIDDFEVAANFQLRQGEITKLIKSSSFVEANKVYLQQVEGRVFFTLTDEQLDNCDAFALRLDCPCESEFAASPINFEVVRQLAALPIEEGKTFDIKLLWTPDKQHYIVAISIVADKYSLKYILTPYQK